MGWRAGMAAAALPAVGGCGCVDAGAASDFLPSSSRISAPSPRPSAFLAIRYHLFRKMNVAFRPPAGGVIKNDGLAETRRLRQTDVARNDALEDLRAEERAQIIGDLTRQRGALVIHRQENALDLEVRIQGTSNTHQRVQ